MAPQGHTPVDGTAVASIYFHENLEISLWFL